MKYARFKYEGRIRRGIVKGDLIYPTKGRHYHACGAGVRGIPLEKVKMAAPVKPSKIVAVGLNYTDHAEELNMKLPEEPVIFLKPPSSVIGPGEDIVCPSSAKRIDYEAELAIVIKKKTRNVPEESAEEHILGYTCLNDVTARDLQKSDGQWTRAKSFDTFCPLGPWIETEMDTDNAGIFSYVNGKLKQSSSVSKMVFKPAYLVSFISAVMTLEREDVIATGTPAGIGAVKAGDKVEILIEGIGTLVNNVIPKKE